MTVLSPLALGLLALAVPVVLMYVLKLRRQERVVSSTFLWRRAVDDVQANAPWQRLRRSVLLALQLLALAAFVLAIAQPAYTRSQAFAGDLILIVDQSYGMQAHDVLPSRFAEAQRRARAMVGDLGAGNVLTVIGMGAQPRLAIARSNDHGSIGRAIDSLRPVASPPNWLGSLSLAASLARGGEITRVVVLTSRDSGIATLPFPVPFQVELIRIGGRLRDLGITAFSTTQGAQTRAVVRVSNFGTRIASSDLNFYVDGTLADVRPLTLAPGQEQNLFWSSLPSTARRMEVRLTASDDVAADKSAWSLAPVSGTRHVLLVSRGDYFLQTALALDPSVRLRVLAPDAYTPDLAAGYDLTVFEGMLPPLLPPAATLLVAPPAGRVGPFVFGSTQPAGAVVPAPSVGGAQAALLRYLDLSDVHVARARRVQLNGANASGRVPLQTSWMVPVAVSQAGGSGGATLIAAGERAGSNVPGSSTRLALVNFDLQESDWPLRISFPLLLENLLHYLVPGLAADASRVSAGHSIQFYPPPGTRVIQVGRPDGSVDRLAAPFAPFTDTSESGLYNVRAIGGSSTPIREMQFAVNFFPARSAPVAGPSTVWLGRSRAGSARSPGGAPIGVPVSLGWAFGLLAIGALMVEWWFAFRR